MREVEENAEKREQRGKFDRTRDRRDKTAAVGSVPCRKRM